MFFTVLFTRLLQLTAETVSGNSQLTWDLSSQSCERKFEWSQTSINQRHHGILKHEAATQIIHEVEPIWHRARISMRPRYHIHEIMLADVSDGAMGP